MNAIYFGAKRVFHGFLRITREPFKSNGVTAARFDLMMVLRQAHSEEGSSHRRLWQSKLWRELGVSPSVVCRMVQALEQLGLIRREISARDRRQREVVLTDKGRQCLREAYRMVVRWVARFVYEVICYGKHRDRDARFVHMSTLESYMDALRTYCRDSATLYYAWGHPDD